MTKSEKIRLVKRDNPEFSAAGIAQTVTDAGIPCKVQDVHSLISRDKAKRRKRKWSKPLRRMDV